MNTFDRAMKDILFYSEEGSLGEVKSYINGEWELGTALKKAPKIHNPTTGEALYCVPDVYSRKIKKACNAASFAQMYWHYEVGQNEKEHIFRRLAALLEEHRAELTQLQVETEGRLLKFADAEVGGALNSIWHYHGAISRVEGSFSRTRMMHKATITVREPYGVIVGITPCNSTLVQPCRKVCAALAGGNAIILKPSEVTAVVPSFLCYFFQYALKDVLGEERFKKACAVFQVLHGRGETVGKMLLEEGVYDKVLFTGSRESGAKVAATAGLRLKPVSLELGGSSAAILMLDFDLDHAICEMVAAHCGDTGQRCVALRRAFVHEDVYDEFLKRYIEKIKSLNIGDPALHTMDVGPLLSEDIRKKVELTVARSIKEGAKLAAGGALFDAIAGNCGFFYEPTVLLCNSTDVYSMREEIFGPVLSVMRFNGKTKEEALMNAVKLVNASRFGLSNAVFTNDIPLAMRAMDRVKSGVFYIGRGTTGAEEGLPFGGVKDSGFGREAGGIEEVTYKKQVYIDFHGKSRAIVGKKPQ